MILKASEVVVKDRIRADIGTDEEMSELMFSLTGLGQLQPIVVREVDGTFELTAGERRLTACRKIEENGQTIKHLQPGMIEAVIKEEAPRHVQLMMEYDENAKRKDFDYVERAKFIRIFHETMVDHAKTIGAGEWQAMHTAAALKLSQASISHYLRIEEAIKVDPSVAKAETLTAAVKRMKVTEKLRARQVAVQDNAPEAYRKAESILLHGDALELIKALPDNSIDCINFDPPWGDDAGHKSNENHEGFDDDTETSDRIINGLLPDLYRVLKDDRILIFWFRLWGYQDMQDRLISAGFNLKFGKTPALWFKPDKITDQNRFPEKQFIDSYEPFFVARKGDPVFHVQNKQNVFSHVRVPVSGLLHPTEKPLSLCTDLISIFTAPGEIVLDPTAGSSAFLHSALVNNRRAKGFELSKTYYDRGVTRLAAYLKTIKEAEVK